MQNSISTHHFDKIKNNITKIDIYPKFLTLSPIILYN